MRRKLIQGDRRGADFAGPVTALFFGGRGAALEVFSCAEVGLARYRSSRRRISAIGIRMIPENFAARARPRQAPETTSRERRGFSRVRRRTNRKRVAKKASPTSVVTSCACAVTVGSRR